MIGRAGSVAVFALCACGRVAFDSAPPDAAGGATADATDATLVPGPLPVIGGLTDDFNDGVRAGFWFSYEETGSTLVEAGGTLTVNLAEGVANSYSGYVTATGYDMRGHSMVLHVLESSPSLQANCYASVVAFDDSHNLEMIANTTFLQIVEDDVELARVPFALPADAWWRIREDRGTVGLDTSPDGRAWVQITTLPAQAYLASVKPNIGGGTFAAATSPGRCVFDDFNLPPP